MKTIGILLILIALISSTAFAFDEADTPSLPGSAFGNVYKATVVEVSANRDILVEIVIDSGGSEYYEIPSTSLYSSSPRVHELPYVGDTCLIAFLGDELPEPVIFGFCSSSPGEHDNFRHEEDRRITLPNDGSMRIAGSSGRMSVSLPSDLSLNVMGISPGITITSSGSLLGKFIDSIILRSKYLMITISGKTHFELGEFGLKADKLNAEIGEVVLDSNDIKLGGEGGKGVARKGDKIIIPRGNIKIVDGKVAEDVEGEIVEGSDSVKATD